MSRFLLTCLTLLLLVATGARAAGMEAELYQAVGAGDIDKARKLIEAGADVNLPQPLSPRRRYTLPRGRAWRW